LRRNTGRLRTLEGRRALAAGSDVHDARVQPAVARRVEDRLQIRAAPADADADAEGHAQRTRGASGRASSTAPMRIASGSARSAARSSLAAMTATRPMPMFQVPNA